MLIKLWDGRMRGAKAQPLRNSLGTGDAAPLRNTIEDLVFLAPELWKRLAQTALGAEESAGADFFSALGEVQKMDLSLATPAGDEVLMENLVLLFPHFARRLSWQPGNFFEKIRQSFSKSGS